MISNNSIAKIETNVDVKEISCSRSEKRDDTEKDVEKNNYTIDVASCSRPDIKLERHISLQDGKNEITSCSGSGIEGDTSVENRKEGDVNNYIYDLGIKNMPDKYKEVYEAYINEIKALSAIPILESITEESIRNFKPYNERYYDDKYCIHFGVTEASYCDINIRIHTNKLLLIALASGNDIIRSQKDILQINFVINNTDRSMVNVKGKRKYGSKSIEPHTILCQVKYQGDDKMYNIRAGINGRIIEINELIKKNPNLIRTDPKGLGFIAVVAPQGSPQDYEKRVSKLNLLSEEDYFEYLLQRPPSIAMNS